MPQIECRLRAAFAFIAAIAPDSHALVPNLQAMRYDARPTDSASI
jgi:hypothetical protein